MWARVKHHANRANAIRPYTLPLASDDMATVPTTFTTWTALRDSLRDALAKRDLTIRHYRGPDGTACEYRTVDELIKLEAFASERALTETTPAGSASRRCYVMPHGDNW